MSFEIQPETECPFVVPWVQPCTSELLPLYIADWPQFRYCF